MVRGGRQYGALRKRKWHIGPAESENQRMYASSLHGNREILEAADRNPAVGPVGEGQEAEHPTCTSLGSRTKA
ncbi:hypothetical protein DESUT3_21240 [Desulfuromonas versatilis]|uniref:Uncharacterized protein n=1 Tax=Desulfuromonas versatilis TaxID=2802975 RepID=A0ABM8HPY6_9BACT|nr:hypothetical protein DESUT3_21240 [Desulfuromonas versatilis]